MWQYKLTVPANVSWVLGMCPLTFWLQTYCSCLKWYAFNKSKCIPNPVLAGAH